MNITARMIVSQGKRRNSGPMENALIGGAFGGINQASKTGNPGDLNLNGIVNFYDFAELSRMRGNQAIIEDLNKYRTVDLPDFAEIAVNRLWEKQ